MYAKQVVISAKSSKIDKKIIKNIIKNESPLPIISLHRYESESKKIIEFKYDKQIQLEMD